mgnify:CR=1 FL=1
MADMSNEQAARVLMERADVYDIPDYQHGSLKGVREYAIRQQTALRMGAAALRSGWVKTADRLPTEPDDYPFIVYMEGWFEALRMGLKIHMTL